MNKYKLIIQGETGIFTGFFKSPNVFASSKLNVTITKGDSGLFLGKVIYDTEEIANLEGTNVRLHYLLHNEILVSLMQSGLEARKRKGTRSPVSLDVKKEIMKTRLDVFFENKH